MIDLPIDRVLDEVVAKLKRRGALVVEASPGAGKTTRVPRALLDALLNEEVGRASRGEIIVLEPRRLAARMSAQRVAEELGEAVGERVGYRVRFDSKVSRRTQLTFVTEGVLTRRLTSDPNLKGVRCVVVDELHERHLQCDLALALVARLRRTTRPDLQLVAMSATLDAAAVVALLDAEHVSCDVERFEVRCEHLPPSREPLDVRVAAAVRQLVNEGLDGHVLCFLPGAAEIRRAMERCAGVARQHQLLLCPLHGSLPAREQDAALAPSTQRKVILATNVAETSLTIDGVAAVIDSGLVKVAVQHPWATMPRLEQRLVCKASATQRAGRAGRTRHGRCLRLYGEHELARQPDYETPEIERSDLCELLLTLHATGARDDVRWLTPPASEALERAAQLLGAIGALADGITPLGRQLLALPLHPRLGRVLLEACALGVADRACDALAVMSETSRRPGSSNLWDRVAQFRQSGRQLGRQSGRASGGGRAVERTSRQLRRICARLEHGETPADEDEALMIALARGFLDRIAKRTAGSDLQLADGGRAQIRGEAPALCVVLDAELGRPGEAARVRLAAAVDSDVLLLAFVDDIIDETVLEVRNGRVERVSRLRFRKLVLDETRRVAQPSAEASALLLRAAEDAGGFVTLGGDALARLLARARHAGMAADVDALFAHACEGLVSLRELREAGLEHLLAAQLDRERLAKLAPDRIRLGAAELSVHYPEDAAPWIASYLQDFFGLARGPELGGKPLVLHLWAPNRRAVQVTSDLARFWQVHYPELRRQLMRRYPKHHWPERPASARAVRLKRHLTQ